MQIIINRRHLMLFFVIIFSLPTALAFARSPSFDCARAIRPDERTICSDEQLIVLDLLADSAYQYLRSHLGKSQANKLNLPFIKQRQNCNTNIACIRRVQLSSIRTFKENGAQISVPPQDALVDRTEKVVPSEKIDDTTPVEAQPLKIIAQQSSSGAAAQATREEIMSGAEEAVKINPHEDVRMSSARQGDEQTASPIPVDRQPMTATSDADPIAMPLEGVSTTFSRAQETVGMNEQPRKFSFGLIAVFVALVFMVTAVGARIIFGKGRSVKSALSRASTISQQEEKTPVSPKQSPQAQKTVGTASTFSSLVARELSKDAGDEAIPMAWVWSRYGGKI